MTLAAGRKRSSSSGPRSSASAPLDVSQSYRRHAKFVWRMLRHLGVPEEFADDAVQDVFIVVARHAERYDAARPLEAWLVGIARRVALDYGKLRRRHRRRREALGVYVATRGSTEAIPRAEAAQLVRSLLESLSEPKRVVLVLTELEGWTGPEISAALSVPLNTVYGRLAAARKQLEALAREVGPVASGGDHE